MSPVVEQRTIEELIALYELEPTVRDIYVEGLSDKVFIEWFLDEKSIIDVSVYEISTVDVPFESIMARDLPDNNRARVITLALTLHDSVPFDLTRQVACLADTDFDHLREKEYECSILIFTGYTSIEVYLFDVDVLKKFLTLVIVNFPLDAATVLLDMAGILPELFLIRLASEELEFNTKGLPLDKFCSLQGGRIQFDLETYRTRYLQKSSRTADRQVFEQTIEKYRRKLGSDPRKHIHGHDFTTLLAVYIAKLKKRASGYDGDLLARSLFGVVEVRHVEHKPAFVEIVRRFQR